MSDNFRQTAPDWSSQYGDLGAPLLDLSELAPRLGSPNTYRRSGRVLYQDAFDYNGFVPKNCNLYLSMQRPFAGSACLVLVNNLVDTGGSAYKCFPLLDTRTIGIEVFIANRETGYTDPFKAGILLETFSSTSYKKMGVRFNYPDQNFEYLTSSDTWGVLSSARDIDLIAYQYQNVKFVADLESNTYKRIYFNDLLFSEPDYTLYYYVAGAPQGKTMQVSVLIDDENLQGLSAAFDNVIVTVDEP